MYKRVSLVLLFAMLLFASSSQPAAPAPSSAPRTLFIADIRDIAPIDPAQYSHTIGRTMLRNVYEPLVYYKLGSFEIEPRLALSWERSANGLQYTVRLRRNVRFHSGDPFTAEDVKMTFDRVLAIGRLVPTASLGGSLKSTEVIDDYTVRFTLNFPYGFFMEVVPKVPIINAEDVRTHQAGGDWANAWFLKNANGTGPYRLANWTPGESYVLERNRNWWGTLPDRAYERVVMRVISEGAVQRQLLERGDLHLVSDWMGAFDKIDAARAASDKVKLIDSGGVMQLLLIIHAGKKPLDNKLVRQALLAAFPYERFQQYYRGYARAPSGPFSKAYPSTNQSLLPLKQNLPKAKELLARAGYPNGGFKLDYDYDQGAEEKRQAALLYQAALKELGIELVINALPGAVRSEKMFKAETAGHFNVHYEAPETSDPFQWIKKMFGCGGYLMQTYLCIERLDKVIDDGQRSADPRRRTQLLQQAERIILDEALMVPASLFNILHAVSRCVEGYIFDYTDLQGVPKFWTMYQAQDCN